MDDTQRLPGALGLGDEGGHLVGFHGEGAVHAAVGTAEGKVLFDDRRAEGHGGDADTDAVGVVREADLAAEELAQVGDGSQVAVLRAGRVGAGAFEQHDVVAAAVAQGPHGFVELGEGGHAGGDDDRLAGSGDLADQGEIGVLEGGDLVARRVERFEELD